MRVDWVFMGIFIVFFLAMSATRGKVAIRKDPIFCLLFLFVLAITISGISPLQMGKDRLIDFLTTWAQYLICIAGFIAICNIHFEESEYYSFIKLYLVVAFILSIFGILQWFLSIFGIEIYMPTLSDKYLSSLSGHEKTFLSFNRATSIFTEPRHFGNSLITPICIAVYIQRVKGIAIFKNKKYIKLLAIFLVFGLLVSFSLSAYIVAVSCMLLISCYFSKTKFLNAIKIFLIFIACALLVQLVFDFYFDFNLFDHYSSRTSININLENIFVADRQSFGLTRYLIGALYAIRLFVFHPIIGVGLNQTNVFIDKEIAWVVPPFELLASVGSLGFIIFVFFIIFLFRKLISTRKYLKKQDDKRYQPLTAIGIILLIVAVVKSIGGSRYNYGSVNVWFEFSLAGSFYFFIRKKVHRRLKISS